MPLMFKEFGGLTWFCIIPVMLAVNSTASAQLSGERGIVYDERVSVYQDSCGGAEFTAKYSFRTLMGEPVVDGTYKYEPYGNRCDKLHYSTKIFIKVYPDLPYGYKCYGCSVAGYILLDPAVPEEEDEYGFSVSGSPDWDELFYIRPDINSSFHNEEQSKILWKYGEVQDNFVKVVHEE